MFYGVLGPSQYLLHRVIRQRFQPQFLYLLELLGVGKGGVVLVVVIQTKQGKDLVDGIDVVTRRGLMLAVSLPRRCR